MQDVHGPSQRTTEHRVEDTGRLGKTAQGTARHAEHALDLLKGAGLLKGAQRLAVGVEHEEEKQGQVLVHVQDAAPGAVTPATGVVETFQQPRDLLEILESAEFVLLDPVSLWVAPASYY